MTQMESHAAALRELSRALLAVAASNNRWDAKNLRAHACVLDRIALELVIDDDPMERTYPHA
ncbi:MAG: hypothetical protein ACE5Q3_19290 [Alphaproteobacteria bacterium]